MAGELVTQQFAADQTGLHQLVETARAYADNGMAENTRRAYGSDWRDFTSWCASVGVAFLPADPRHVALYLTARAPVLAASTLARRMAAIRTAHREADLPPPTSGDLTRVIAGIRRAHARPPRKKRALVTQDLKKVIAKLPDTPRGARDKALILVGFAGALRRSELAALELDTPGAGPVRCAFVAQGLELHLDRSKGDQEARGAVVGVPAGKTKACPVLALEAWLKISGITSGPIFRGIDRHGRLAADALTPYAVASIVKAAAEAAGLDPRKFGGHSLRAGLVTSAAAAGVATDVIMRQTRHARVDTVLGYIRDGERFARNAAGKVGL